MQYLRQYISYYIRTWHGGRLVDTLYAHARFDDLDLDTRSQWIGEGKQSVLNYFDKLSQQKALHLLQG